MNIPDHAKSNESLNNVRSKDKKSCVDLPVFRHLSEEFRAKLPPISPRKPFKGFKKCTSKAMTEDYSERISAENMNGIVGDMAKMRVKDPEKVIMENEKSLLRNDINDKRMLKLNHVVSEAGPKECVAVNDGKNIEGPSKARVKKMTFKDPNQGEPRKGGYFLSLLKQEQEKIILLANQGEKYLTMLADNSEVTEDVMGLLRAASGKARLLVSQKMKQFEDLCQKNLTTVPGDKFFTSNDDLQGFWDIVFLQIEHINTIFKEIETLKANNWKQVSEEKTVTSARAPRTARGSARLHREDPPENPALVAAAQKREAQRREFLELKRKRHLEMLKNKSNHTSAAVEPAQEALN